MTTVLAVDPGSERSAWLVYNGAAGGIRAFATVDNDELLEVLRADIADDVETVVIEKIESYGMAVGREVFDTVWWSGRFTEAARPTAVVQLPRRAVKLAICGDTRAKDANIRQALLDRFGGARAKGTKAAPGPLYGIAGDAWSALAIAITYSESGVTTIDDTGRFPAERSEG